MSQCRDSFFLGDATQETPIVMHLHKNYRQKKNYLESHFSGVCTVNTMNYRATRNTLAAPSYITSLPHPRRDVAPVFG
jgi:hypothetical protein